MERVKSEWEVAIAVSWNTDFTVDLGAVFYVGAEVKSFLESLEYGRVDTISAKNKVIASFEFHVVVNI